MFAGILGVPLGSLIAQRLRHIFSSIDPQVCGIGMLLSSPLTFIVLLTATYGLSTCLFFVFLAELSVNLTWSIVSDMLLVRNDDNYLVSANNAVNLQLSQCVTQYIDRIIWREFN